jgi:hypothetical protein
MRLAQKKLSTKKANSITAMVEKLEELGDIRKLSQLLVTLSGHFLKCAYAFYFQQDQRRKLWM